MAEPTSVDGIRRAILDQITTFAGPRPDGARLRTLVEDALGRATAEEVEHLVVRVTTTGRSWGYQPPEPLARRLQHVIAEVALAPDSELLDGHHLDGVRSAPLVLLPNHLSYADANVVEILLTRAGYGDVAARLTVFAGPKVYSDPFRRFSSLCFGTIKTPQSTTRSSDEAVMSAREVARLALESIDVASGRQGAGDALLIFAEGTRSRSGGMQRTLPAVARYLGHPGAWIIPVGVTGTERIIPVGTDRILAPSRVTARVGLPIDAGKLLGMCGSNRRLAMDALGVAISRTLPAEYRGTYTDTSPEFGEASRVAAACATPAGP